MVQFHHEKEKLEEIHQGTRLPYIFHMNWCAPSQLPLLLESKEMRHHQRERMCHSLSNG